jgi:hypothetical protein
MQLRLWWWRKVRIANIPPESREVFERFGEDVIAQMVASGFSPRAAELEVMYREPKRIAEASAWLTERGDKREQHEQRLETAEWAILIFVFMGVILDCILVTQGWLLHGGH